MIRSTYVVALGSNRPGRHGGPAAEVAAALDALGTLGRMTASRVITSAPVGPSLRRFCNAVALVRVADEPLEMLRRLKSIERAFGRRRGERWSARVIDLDIVLWSGGAFRTTDLVIPHRLFRERDFVLRPLLDIAPCWRDPITHRSVRQLHARLTSRRALPRRDIAGAGP
ncbi:2-amino-4-hydroxy-6-hydroxymethyldihydropteridine diphosphokinase [Sphingomonas sp. NBWT7]|uniref:2-amino-4-hydroxy-6- hydroxymethyldihydropteridine diphosphokinase n=1 Tax=Sphingomonas sp. NBWT7 TaxID=2596913 RepID=UPI001623D9FC|nr:2-amino-4-hydroxy-6-hydroxymethyldihydropteridine diphosphokinase [Sphingomonas sp. NBWT7]QNE31670.1 2-amino-4-hydroxy-6-hydroxymethyldihydropteridine diphosphokinase [Sphingomonas sp. NBWT7]